MVVLARARALFVLLVNRRQTIPLSEDTRDIIIHGRPRRSNGRSHLLSRARIGKYKGPNPLHRRNRLLFFLITDDCVELERCSVHRIDR